jgi:hypothetical protein
LCSRLLHKWIPRSSPSSKPPTTLLKENDSIHKCGFVVDRKDLDRQTREEFNRFQEGCVEENTVVFFPKPDEQQRIADCLTSLDDLIAAQA